MRHFFILIFLLFTLISCSSTVKFEQLADDKKTEITQKIQSEILGEMMSEMMPLAMSDISEEEIDTKMKALFGELMDEKIVPLYPNVDFSDLIKNGLEQDNSIVEAEKELETEKEYKQVELNTFSEIQGANDVGEMKLKISDIVWKGKEITEGWNTIEGNNELLTIKFEGENIGKKETFISFYGAKLLTSDGYEYGYKDTLQINETQEGFVGCLECSMNPLTKGEQYLVFDIPKIDLAGAQIIFEEELIAFEL